MVNGMQFDDAVSSVVENKNDATFVAKAASGTEEAAQEALSTTIVVENPKLVTSLMPKTVQDMMTDDESEEEEPKKPVKPIRAIPKPTKQVFSPFEQSPVKKKVIFTFLLPRRTNATFMFSRRFMTPRVRKK